MLIYFQEERKGLGASLPAPKVACVLSECGFLRAEQQPTNSLLGFLLAPSNPQPATVLCSTTHIPVASLMKNLPQLASKVTEALQEAIAVSTKQDKTKPRIASVYSDPAISLLGICQKDSHRCQRRNVQNANALHLEND